MAAVTQYAMKDRNQLTPAFGVAGVATLLVLLALLAILGVSPVPFALAGVTTLLLWLVFRYPLSTLGLLLAFMTIYTLVFLLAEFLGPPYIGVLKGSDRAALLLPTLALWRQNRIKMCAPDWLLVSCLGFATLRLAFGGTSIGLLTDFSFVIAYTAGRVTVLTSERKGVWARRAIWIVAVISVLGMTEVFFIGEGPRTVLYVATADEGTQGNSLDAAFHGEGYSGLRESATMFGPLQFAPLCMTALIFWWVYGRNPVPAVMIASGLICSVTRSAWVGTAVAICVLAFMMNQTKRLLSYAALFVALFLAAIPILGLRDYLVSTRTGQDPSEQGHKESLLQGVTYIVLHPLGSGPGNVGKFAVVSDSAAPGFENTYLTLAGEYGIPGAFCFMGFLASVLLVLRRQRTKPAYVAVAIVVGFGTVMMFAPLHDFFPLACWLWFPVGLAVRSAAQRSAPMPPFELS